VTSRLGCEGIAEISLLGATYKIDGFWWQGWLVGTMSAYPEFIVVSVEGQVGAGKSYLLEHIAAAMPDVMTVPEPVGEWMTLKNAAGKSLLELFYEDKHRWSYTFQNCAILTRILGLKNALRDCKKKIIITERSVLTDRFVFAEMLRDAGDIDAMEWDLYMKWYDAFAADLPVKGVIHLTTGVGTSAERIIKRGRHGEEHIPIDYLSALDAQHHKWLDNSKLPVLKISTEPGVSLEENLASIRTFVDGLLAEAERSGSIGSGASRSAVKMGDGW
jgi:deoxyadenosine/deoxycytidine kinase